MDENNNYKVSEMDGHPLISHLIDNALSSGSGTDFFMSIVVVMAVMVVMEFIRPYIGNLNVNLMRRYANQKL